MPILPLEFPLNERRRWRLFPVRNERFRHQQRCHDFSIENPAKDKDLREVCVTRYLRKRCASGRRALAFELLYVWAKSSSFRDSAFCGNTNALPPTSEGFEPS